MIRMFAVVITALAGFSGADHAAAQEFPSKLIRIVAPSPGGGGDFVALLLSSGALL